MLKNYKIETNNSERKTHDIFFITTLIVLLSIGLIGQDFSK